MEWEIFVSSAEAADEVVFESNGVNIVTTLKESKYVEGCIQFNFGYETSLSLAHIPIKPEEKMILIFPSEVYHYVYPFRDRESERVSISGNLKWKS